MPIFIGVFLLIIALYHILVTIGIFGMEHTAYISYPAIIRDIIRGTAVGIFFLFHRKQRKAYFTQRKGVRISLIALLVFGTGISLFQDKSIFTIFVGIKYGFLYLCIRASATFLGFCAAKNNSSEKVQSRINTAMRFLISIVLFGFIWQIAKKIVPEMFYRLGYGPVGDFAFGENPPLYYRTGPGGTMRLQGMFSGPNNYGYFLVAFLPLIIAWLSQQKEKYADRKKRLIGGVRGLAITGTLSRSAVIGSIIGLGTRYRKLRVQKKRLVIACSLIAVSVLIALSVRKRSSTREHIAHKRAGVEYVIQKPLGYGLGTAGPAIHHNGTILPENYYLQLMIDVGTVGFLLWALCMFAFLHVIKVVRRRQDFPFSYILRAFHIGFFSLLIMGFFLHVFEDSMVIYLFFVPYGWLLGYGSRDSAEIIS